MSTFSCVCVFFYGSIDRANRLTNEHTSVAAGKNQSPPMEAKSQRTEGQSTDVYVRVVSSSIDRANRLINENSSIVACVQRVECYLIWTPAGVRASV